jgi:hypothetical protein
MTKTILISSLLVPVIAKTYQGSMRGTFTQTPNNAFYISFFSFILSEALALFIFVFIE